MQQTNVPTTGLGASLEESGGEREVGISRKKMISTAEVGKNDLWQIHVLFEQEQCTHFITMHVGGGALYVIFFFFLPPSVLHYSLLFIENENCPLFLCPGQLKEMKALSLTERHLLSRQ